MPAVGGRSPDVVDRARTPPRRARRTTPPPRAGSVTSPATGPAEPNDARSSPRSRSAATASEQTAITIAFRGPTFMNVCAAPDGHDPHAAAISSSGAAAFRFGPTRNSRSGSVRAPRDGRELDRRLLDEQRRQRVARRRGRPEVPAERAAVADLRRADRPRRLGERRQQRARAAPPSPPRTSGPTPSRSVPFSRDQPRSSGDLVEVQEHLGPAAVEVELDHHVRAALDRHGVRVLGLHAQRLVERSAARRRPSSAPPARTGCRAPRARPRRRSAEPGRDEDEHDDGHDVRQRVQELGLDLRTRAPGARRAGRRRARRTGRRRRGTAPARQKAKITSAIAIQPAPPTSESPSVQPGVIERL